MKASEIYSIKVKPKSSQSRMEKQADGTWVAWLNSPPVDGKANKELLRLVAETAGVSKSRVTLVGGGKSRMKRVAVQ
ncbi:DUF167 domain-containing protein [Kiritimatiellota bacterium B12222]|nr:DUF167 domain-containing protein [Kiritimatiellota bacterium B12222]